MSKPRHYWHNFVQQTIQKYPDDLDESIQSEIARGAIKQALQDTARMRDGKDRLKLINLVLFEKSHTVDGAAFTIGVSERTAKRWKRAFINAVAKRMGFNTK